jgi:hypothetical protein
MPVRTRLNAMLTAALATALLLIYLPTLQTIVNGSSHYTMIDVGEIQTTLNVWGTIHATGYPLYTMIGSAAVSLMRALGVPPATAPGLLSTLFGLAALSLLFALAVNVLASDTQSENGKAIGATRASPLHMSAFARLHKSLVPTLAALAVILLFGLTRTVWIYNVVAKYYSFNLLLMALLLLLALWKPPVRGRLYGLALLGGVAVFHHRALLTLAPALLFAVWRDLRGSYPLPEREKGKGKRRKSKTEEKAETESGNLQLETQSSVLIPQSSSHIPSFSSVLSPQYLVLKKLFTCLLLGAVGFLPYLYLPLRANAGAAWVYGQPNTWSGFWDQFLGREASQYVGLLTSMEALRANVDQINAVLVNDLTVPGILLGLLGLLIGIASPRQRRAAITLALMGAAAYSFHVVYYTDVLSALILLITLSLAFGWLFLLDAVLRRLPDIRLQFVVLAVLTLPSAFYLYQHNQAFIHDLTNDPTGQETIAIAEGAPPGSTLMLNWGPRYHAVGFAKYVLGDLSNLTLVDHNADFKAILAGGGQLVTPDFTFYNRPVSWWESSLGAKVYLNAVAPHLVALDIRPEMAEGLSGAGARALASNLTCTQNGINLQVRWASADKPSEDLSVFVHLLDENGSLLAQADQAAPVYGWRPLTTWAAGEVVRDVYPLPRPANAARIQYGLYRSLPGGGFQNSADYTIPVKCHES